MSGACGTCTACCRIFSISELNKPAGKWCTHCDIGKGCRIYKDRPVTCVTFKCLWLYSQDEGNDPFPEELRPDKCKVVFSPTTREDIVSLTTMPGYNDAWKKPAVKAVIDFIISQDMSVAIGPTASTTLTVMNKRGTEVVEMDEPDEHGIQWRKGYGRNKG
jgi:hypothetical protein